jgi:ribonuclease-3
VRELRLFHKYLFTELLELLDWEVNDRFLFMPRFVRDLSENGKEILSMDVVVRYLLEAYVPLVDPVDLGGMLGMPAADWLDLTEAIKGMLVTCPGKKPAAFRVDQLDREQVRLFKKKVIYLLASICVQ